MTWQIALLIAVEAAGVLIIGVLFPKLMVERYGDPQPATRHLHVLQTDTDDVSTVRVTRDAGPYDWAADFEADGGAA